MPMQSKTDKQGNTKLPSRTLNLATKATMQQVKTMNFGTSNDSIDGNN